jgi:uncharacterized membrane protein
MAEDQSAIDEIITHGREYLKTRESLAKLHAVDKASEAASAGISGMIVFVIFIFVLLFASIAIAFLATSWLNNAFAGFGVVAVFYLLLGLLVSANREKWLKQPVRNAVIRNYFRDEDED